MRLSQPTETVRVPVSSRPMVCGVVGGTQALATSSSVMPRARRTSLMRVIIAQVPTRYEPIRFPSVLQFLHYGKRHATRNRPEMPMNNARLLAERPIGIDAAIKGRRPPPSTPLNLGENPLGWLFARGHVSRRQLDAGEQLRLDWERAQLAPRVTMSWDAAPAGGRRGEAAERPALNGAQLDARRRFEAAVAAAGPGLADILWRVVCAGEGMRDAEPALGWPGRGRKAALAIAPGRTAR